MRIYHSALIANTVRPSEITNTYSDVASFIAAASAGHIVRLLIPVPPVEDHIANLVAHGVNRVSLVVYEHWPGLTFEPHLVSMLNDHWELVLYSADQWEESAAASHHRRVPFE